jgi:hypothetical protein
MPNAGDVNPTTPTHVADGQIGPSCTCPARTGSPCTFLFSCRLIQFTIEQGCKLFSWIGCFLSADDHGSTSNPCPWLTAPSSASLHGRRLSFTNLYICFATCAGSPWSGLFLRLWRACRGTCCAGFGFRGKKAAAPAVLKLLLLLIFLVMFNYSSYYLKKVLVTSPLRRASEFGQVRTALRAVCMAARFSCCSASCPRPRPALHPGG